MTTSHPVNKAVRLADLLSLNADKPTFDSVFQTHYGNVNLIGLSAGQQLSEHTAPCDVLVLLLEGDVAFTVEGQPNALTPGLAIIMPAGTPHSVAANADSKILLVKIDN